MLTGLEGTSVDVGVGDLPNKPPGTAVSPPDPGARVPEGDPPCDKVVSRQAEDTAAASTRGMKSDLFTGLSSCGNYSTRSSRARFIWPTHRAGMIVPLSITAPTAVKPMAIVRTSNSGFIVRPAPAMCSTGPSATVPSAPKATPNAVITAAWTSKYQTRAQS